MSFSKVHSAQVRVLDAAVIDVEVDLSGGLHAFSIVGLPDKAVEEARDRVSSAIKNSGFKSPKTKNQKVVISLAPADIKKEGSNFDLAIALGYLLAAQDIRFNPQGKLFLGELALDGRLRPVTGILPLVRQALESGFTEVYVPEANAEEAALIGDVSIFAVPSLSAIVSHLNEKAEKKISLKKKPQTKIVPAEPDHAVDISDIKGQETAKRGLEIAAAGAHNIAMYGPPGTGKTMLARAFATLLPQLSFDEILEVTSIHSVAGILKPGEITLAHRGVLFLDEFPEFEHRVIEALRQPLEDRIISISRVKGSATYPAQFILVAAMNPCPCGNYGTRKECVCTPKALQRYRKKLSGPIIDRVDMWVEVGNIEYKALSSEGRRGEKSETVRERIQAARKRQTERYEKAELAHRTNSELSARHIDKLIPLDEKVRELLNQSATKLGL